MLRLLLFLLLFTFQAAAQSGTGSVAGRVFDGSTQSNLIGATVTIEGTALRTQTDRSGGFWIGRVPSGQQKLRVTFLGYQEAVSDVQVGAGEQVDLEIGLVPEFRTTVTVTAEEPILEGQAQALNQQKTAENIQSVVAADQIGRFPDPNAAEAIQRLPGVTLQRDQGEGRFILIRGSEPRLTSTSINGERIPSPEGDIRFVALDVVPADLLEAIEVNKTLRADMEGDAIGGAINLVTKSAPSKTRASLTVGGGLNRISDGPISLVNGTIGRRFANDRFGIVAGGSFVRTDRGSDNFEPEYDDGDLAVLELRDYLLTRQRWGFNTTLDYKLNPGSQLFLRGIFNKFDDDERRRVVAYVVEDGEIARAVRDRFETQAIASVSLGGQHAAGTSWLFDWRFSYSYAEEDEPRAIEGEFIQENVVFNPNVSPTMIDPRNIQANPQNEDFSLFELNEVTSDDNFTSDRDIAFQFNASAPFVRSDSNLAGRIQFGGKFRDKNKDRNNSVLVFEPQNTVFLTDVLDSSFRVGRFLDGRYIPGDAFVDVGTQRAFRSDPTFDVEADPEEDLADFDATERVAAAYVMGEFNFGGKFSLVPGFRYEYTDVDYTGTEVLFDVNGDFVATQPVRGGRSYHSPLPSLNAKYRIGENTNLRAAVTRSLSRPNFEEVVPSQLILEEDEEIERGNPNLKVTRATNVDVLAEHYFSTVGLVSAGFFYKDLDDIIFFRTFDEDRGGVTFEVTEPANGPTARIAGLEFAFQNHLRFLPSPFDGLGLYANYTFTDGTARLPGRTGGILPGQPRHVSNLALAYEKRGFSGRISMNLHDHDVSEVGDSAAEDIFIDKHIQLDLSASQRIYKNVRVFAEILNLTNEPLRVYEGFRDRPIQGEFYRWWATFGVKVDF